MGRPHLHFVVRSTFVSKRLRCPSLNFVFRPVPSRLKHHYNAIRNSLKHQ